MTYYKALEELKELLNQPLPGGRGFQAARDNRIKWLCGYIASCDTPRR